MNSSDKNRIQMERIASEIARRKSDTVWRRTQNFMIGTSIMLIMVGALGLAVAIINT